MNTLEPLAEKAFLSYLDWLLGGQFLFYQEAGLSCDVCIVERVAGKLPKLADYELKLSLHPELKIPYSSGTTFTLLCKHYFENMLGLIGDLFEEEPNQKLRLDCFCALKEGELPTKEIGIGDGFPLIQTVAEWEALKSGNVVSELHFVIPLIHQRHAQNYREAFLQTLLIPALRRAGWHFVELRTIR